MKMEEQIFGTAHEFDYFGKDCSEILPLLIFTSQRIHILHNNLDLEVLSLC